MSAEKNDQRPQRRITILFIATGGLFAFYATILGALMLASLSGINLPFDYRSFFAHPYLQIFGFLSEFVVGVSYSLLPLFKSRKLPSIKLAYFDYSLMTVSNLLIITASFQIAAGVIAFLHEISGVLLLLASAVFSIQTLTVLRYPSKLLGEAEPFMALSSVSMVIIAALFFLAQFPSFGLRNNAQVFTPSFLYLSLVGFVGSMIYGVELRTVALRLTTYLRGPTKLGFALQCLAVGMAGLGAFIAATWIIDLASMLFLTAAVSIVAALRVFSRSSTLLPVGNPALTNRELTLSHNSISTYSKVCILFSSSWIIFSCFLGVLWLVSGSTSFGFRDSFIHSIALGFIGSAILSYGPVLLPGVLSQKAPNIRLSLWPLILLNLGIALRDGGNLYSGFMETGLPIWEALSGVFVLAAMLMFMRTLHFGQSKV